MGHVSSRPRRGKSVNDIICCICKFVLKEPGAILLSPPIATPHTEESDEARAVVKRHICVHCYYPMVEKLLK